MKRNVLILGNGAREHALAKKFCESEFAGDIYVYPGNDGIFKEFKSLLPPQAIGNRHYTKGGDVCSEFQEIHDCIIQKNIDLVFVGNEQYLADGVVNHLTERGIKVIGPTREAAQIESSKVFSKRLMKQCGVPTARELDTDLGIIKYPVVIKADGLAAGKGVLIAENKVDAEIFISEMLSGNKFGDAGKRVVIEEFLEGEEASIFAFCDGENFVSTIFAQDHKRAFDDDNGLNTGGMGAFAPVSKFSHLKDKLDELVFEPILKGKKEEGITFIGELFAGLMIKGSEINVIEFNCRFGDPEAQVILPLLENDLFEICDAIIDKKINEVSLKWKSKFAVNVVLASIGYPESFKKGCKIHIDNRLLKDDKLYVYFSGVKEDSDNNCFVNSGGRVLSITGIDDSLKKTVDFVYDKIKYVKSDILRYRSDIGRKGLT